MLFIFLLISNVFPVLYTENFKVSSAVIQNLVEISAHKYSDTKLEQKYIFREEDPFLKSMIEIHKKKMEQERAKHPQTCLDKVLFYSGIVVGVGLSASVTIYVCLLLFK